MSSTRSGGPGVKSLGPPAQGPRSSPLRIRTSLAVSTGVGVTIGAELFPRAFLCVTCLCVCVSASLSFSPSPSGSAALVCFLRAAAPLASARRPRPHLGPTPILTGRGGGPMRARRLTLRLPSPLRPGGPGTPAPDLPARARTGPSRTVPPSPTREPSTGRGTDDFRGSRPDRHARSSARPARVPVERRVSEPLHPSDLDRIPPTEPEGGVEGPPPLGPRVSTGGLGAREERGGGGASGSAGALRRRALLRGSLFPCAVVAAARAPRRPARGRRGEGRTAFQLPELLLCGRRAHAGSGPRALGCGGRKGPESPCETAKPNRVVVTSPGRKRTRRTPQTRTYLLRRNRRRRGGGSPDDLSPVRAEVPPQPAEGLASVRGIPGESGSRFAGVVRPAPGRVRVRGSEPGWGGWARIDPDQDGGGGVGGLEAPRTRVEEGQG